MKKLIFLLTAPLLCISANVSNIKKTSDKVIVQGRDGSTVSIQALNNILNVQSTNYTLTTTDGYGTVFVTTGNSNRTITLPPVASSMNRRVRVIKADTGTGTVLMAVSTGSLIGAVPKVSSQNGTMDFVCDGASWFLESLHDEGTFTATMTGISAGATTTWAYSRVNSVVTVNMFGNSSGANNNFYWQFTKNGSSGQVTITGHPDSIKPTVASTWIQTWQVSYNNGGSPGTGLSNAGTELDTTQFNVFRSVAGDAFGAGTQSAILANSFSYTIR
jgi:hypothetical protein